MIGWFVLERQRSPLPMLDFATEGYSAADGPIVLEAR